MVACRELGYADTGTEILQYLVTCDESTNTHVQVLSSDEMHSLAKDWLPFSWMMCDAEEQRRDLLTVSMME